MCSNWSMLSLGVQPACTYDGAYTFDGNGRLLLQNKMAHGSFGEGDSGCVLLPAAFLFQMQYSQAPLGRLL